MTTLEKISRIATAQDILPGTYI